MPFRILISGGIANCWWVSHGEGHAAHAMVVNSEDTTQRIVADHGNAGIRVFICPDPMRDVFKSCTPQDLDILRLTSCWIALNISDLLIHFQLPPVDETPSSWMGFQCGLQGFHRLVVSSANLRPKPSTNAGKLTGWIEMYHPPASKLKLKHQPASLGSTIPLNGFLLLCSVTRLFTMIGTTG